MKKKAVKKIIICVIIMAVVLPILYCGLVFVWNETKYQQKETNDISEMVKLIEASDFVLPCFDKYTFDKNYTVSLYSGYRNMPLSVYHFTYHVYGDSKNIDISASLQTNINLVGEEKSEYKNIQYYYYEEKSKENENIYNENSDGINFEKNALKCWNFWLMIIDIPLMYTNFSIKTQQY